MKRIPFSGRRIEFQLKNNRQTEVSGVSEAERYRVESTVSICGIGTLHTITLNGIELLICYCIRYCSLFLTLFIL